MTESKNLHQRINEVMVNLRYIKNDPEKPGMKYRFVSHDQVTAKVRKECVINGIVITSDVKSYDIDGPKCTILLAVTLVNIDDPEDRFTIHGLGTGIDQQGKAPGIATSYAFKYALLKTFMLETGDDAETANQEPEERPAKDEAARSESEQMASQADPDNKERLALQELISGEVERPTDDAGKAMQISNYKRLILLQSRFLGASRQWVGPHVKGKLAKVTADATPGMELVAQWDYLLRKAKKWADRCGLVAALREKAGGAEKLASLPDQNYCIPEQNTWFQDMLNQLIDEEAAQ